MRCKQNKKIKIKIHKIEKSYSKDDDQVDYKKKMIVIMIMILKSK